MANTSCKRKLQKSLWFPNLTFWTWLATLSNIYYTWGRWWYWHKIINLLLCKALLSCLEWLELMWFHQLQPRSIWNFKSIHTLYLITKGIGSVLPSSQSSKRVLHIFSSSTSNSLKSEDVELRLQSWLSKRNYRKDLTSLDPSLSHHPTPSRSYSLRP